MSIVGRWLGIQCYKHNGDLHRVWDRGFVMENNLASIKIFEALGYAKSINSNEIRFIKELK